MDEAIDRESDSEDIQLPLPSAIQEELTIKITGNDDNLFYGLVVQSADDEKGVRIIADFPAASAPILTVGKRTKVEFGGGQLHEPLFADARVVFRTGDVFRQRYQFLVPKEIKESLGVVINRRKAIRVRPRPEEPVQTTLFNVNEPVLHEAVLQDVSTTGACVLVTRDLEEDFYTAINVNLSFSFPEQEQPVEIIGRIRYRKLSGFVIRYGIEFDAKLNPNFEDTVDRIQSYVTKRLVEEVERLNTIQAA